MPMRNQELNEELERISKEKPQEWRYQDAKDYEDGGKCGNVVMIYYTTVGTASKDAMMTNKN